MSPSSIAATTVAEIQAIFDGTEGAIDVHTELQKDIPQLKIEVNLDKAQQYRLKPGRRD